MRIDCEYRLKDDLDFFIEAERIDQIDLSRRSGVSRTVLDLIEKRGTASNDVCEKIYSFIYNNRYRLNSVKEELLKEKPGLYLFHGSKNGVSDIAIAKSRANCDFGQGFYLGQSYSQALSFVCEYDNSSVYSFGFSLDGLHQVEFDCSLDWMLSICYFRGTLKNYANSAAVAKALKRLEGADVVIAPIANNKMFYIMTQFAEGEINADVALHSLSASRLGLQYIIKTENALQKLVPIEKYYLCAPEKEACSALQVKRGYEMDTKLKLAKREFKTGLFIEELLK
jgi:hypothetical protein